MDAKELIRGPLNELFANAPRSRAAWELQEELYANCVARYDDLLAGGSSPQDAMNSVLGSVGNVQEMIAALPGSNTSYDAAMAAAEAEENRVRATTLTAIGMGIYLIAAVAVAAGVLLGSPYALICFGVALVLFVAATVLLVYKAQRYPKSKQYTSAPGLSADDKKQRKALHKGISGLMWPLITILYVVISFYTRAWHLTWMIFLVGSCLEILLGAVTTGRLQHKHLSGLMWLVITMLYFWISFTTGAWYITWVIFLVGACLESAMSLLLKLRRTGE